MSLNQTRSVNSVLSRIIRNSRMFQFRKHQSLAVCGLVVSCLTARGQSFQVGNADLALGGTGQFTTELPMQSSNLSQANLSKAAGVLFSFDVHPLTWAGVELSYHYSRYSEVNVASLGSGNNEAVLMNSQEGTAAYLIHSHSRGFQPFVAIGGGALFFHPSNYADGQLRSVGLLEVGVDVPTINPHVGFRLEGRSLYYRAPTIGSTAKTVGQVEVTVEPTASLYVRF